MKLSVIIPAHNEEKQIENTLKSFKGKNIELVIVCNGCTDNTEKIAKRHTKKVFSVKEANVSKARNFGAKKSTGHILVFHDADTRFSKNYLKEIRKSVQKGYDYGCARQIPETKNLWYNLLIKIVNRNSRKYRIFHGNFFITKELFIKSKGYNPRLRQFEDTDLALRIKGKGNYIYMKNCWIRPSERGFQKKGYFLPIMKILIKGTLFMLRK